MVDAGEKAASAEKTGGAAFFSWQVRKNLWLSLFPLFAPVQKDSEQEATEITEEKTEGAAFPPGR
jgi:hypothetical protein